MATSVETLTFIKKRYGEEDFPGCRIGVIAVVE
jgi:hypothetical protein